MFEVRADSPVRHEIQRLLELSVQPLHLYGTLVRHFLSLPEEAREAALQCPALEDYRDWVRGALPPLSGPFMGLQVRVAMRRILAETPPHEENALCVVFLEYFVSQLETYLQAAEQDPDQASYLIPLCARLNLDTRPVDLLADALRTGRQSTHPVRDRVRGGWRRRARRSVP